MAKKIWWGMPAMALVFGVVLAISLAACGGGNGPSFGGDSALVGKWYQTLEEGFTDSPVEMEFLKDGTGIKGSNSAISWKTVNGCLYITDGDGKNTNSVAYKKAGSTLILTDDWGNSKTYKPASNVIYTFAAKPVGKSGTESVGAFLEKIRGQNGYLVTFSISGKDSSSFYQRDLLLQDLDNPSTSYKSLYSGVSYAVAYGGAVFNLPEGAVKQGTRFKLFSEGDKPNVIDGITLGQPDK